MEPSSSDHHLAGRPRRLRRHLPKAMLTLSVAAAPLAVFLPAAQAAPPPQFAQWSTPVTPPTAVNDFIVGCDGDAGMTAAVSVTPPGGMPKPGSVQIDALGNARVPIGHGTPFPTDVVGTYSASVTCPGYATASGTVPVAAPTVDLTIHAFNDLCTTPQSSFKIGSEIEWCFTIVNHTGEEIRQVGMRQLTDSGTGFANPGPGEHPNGATRTYGALGTEAFQEPTFSGFTFVELGSPGSGVFAVSNISTATVTIPPALSMTETTGLTASTSCPANGGTTTRTVSAGTTVFVCFTVTNTSATTFSPHDLHDSVLGDVLSGDPNPLAPGQTRAVIAPPITVSTSKTLTSTWTTVQTPPDEHDPVAPNFPVGTEFTAHATAALSVPVNTAADPTTPVTPTAVSPEAVVATPDFTG